MCIKFSSLHRTQASIEPVPEPKPEPKFVEIDFPNSSRLDQFKQGIDFEKCREGRIQATTQRGKNKRAQLIYKRRGALCIPEPMAVDDDNVSTTSTTESSSTVPATQGDVVVESAKPLTSLTPISSDLDDESTIVSASTAEMNEWFPVTLPAEPLTSLTPISSDLDDESTIVSSDSTEELNEWFPITLPTKPLASLTPISSDLDDESTIASASTAEMNRFPVEDKVAEPEIPSIVTIIAAEVSSEEEPEYPSIGTIVVEDVSSSSFSSGEEEEEYPFVGTIIEETLQEEEDVVFDTAVEEPFDLQVETEEDQVAPVSDAEHESMVLFLAAFTTADVHVVEEDETPAPIAIEPSTY